MEETELTLDDAIGLARMVVCWQCTKNERLPVETQRDWPSVDGYELSTEFHGSIEEFVLSISWSHYDDGHLYRQHNYQILVTAEDATLATYEQTCQYYEQPKIKRLFDEIRIKTATEDLQYKKEGLAAKVARARMLLNDDRPR